MSEQVRTSRIRSRIDRYALAVILVVSGFIFFSEVPFLPGAPVLPILVAIGVGVACLRRPEVATTLLCLLVFLALAYQLISFGFGPVALAGPRGVVAFALLIAFVGIDVSSAGMRPTSAALGILAVAFMLTPYYYLSVAILVIAVAIDGLQAVAAVSGSFVSTLVPIIVLENAIASSQGIVNSSTGPILFSQFSLLAKNLAPPLRQLNVLGGPSAANSTAVKVLPNYFASSAPLDLVIPTIVLTIILVSSVSVGGLANSLLSKLAWHERAGPIIKATAPLVAALGMSIGFVVLVGAVAPDTSFQAFLLTDSPAAGQPLAMAQGIPLLLVLGATVTGAALSVREFGVQRLERVEFARDELSSLLKEASSLATKATGIIKEIQKGAPTVVTTAEVRQIQEDESRVGDILGGMGNADYQTLSVWVSYAKETLTPQLSRMPEALRIKLIDELSKFVSVGTTYDNMLEQGGLETRFDLQPIDGSMDYVQAIEKYAALTGRIEATARQLFAEYKSTSGAFNKLMSKDLITPPVDPEYLLQSKDYLASMRLVAEDYWLSFQQTYVGDLRAKASALARELRELKEAVDERTGQEIQATLASLESPRPSDSVSILQSLQVLVSRLEDNVAATEGEMKQLEKMVNTVSSNTSRMVHFELLGLAGMMERLNAAVQELSPSFDALGEFSEVLTQSSRRFAEAKKADMRSIVILSHYKIAKEYIEGQLAKKEAVPISDLPFTSEAAALYVRLLSDSTGSVTYDEVNEAILAKNA